MSNKRIYKGLNKKRKFDFRKFITTILCIILIVGYAYKKIKIDEIFKNLNITSNISSITEKLYFWKNPTSEIFNLIKNDTKKSDSQSSKTQDKENDVAQDKQNNDSQESSQVNTEVAVANGIDIYLIQVGSFENDKKLSEVQSKLNKNKIPNSTMSIDSSNKVQAYVSFKEEDIRGKIDSVKSIFEDAFVTKLEIPTLSLEYTKDYEYIKDISDNLNLLLKNYKQESDILNQNKSDLDEEEYKNILNKRNDIIKNLESEVEKIDYEELESFKNNLLSYTSQVKDNVSQCGENISFEEEYKYESLLINSLQMYYEFINKIKVA